MLISIAHVPCVLFIAVSITCSQVAVQIADVFQAYVPLMRSESIFLAMRDIVCLLPVKYFLKHGEGCCEGKVSELKYVILDINSLCSNFKGFLMCLPNKLF